MYVLEYCGSLGNGVMGMVNGTKVDDVSNQARSGGKLRTDALFVAMPATETEPIARISAMPVTKLAIDYNRRTVV